MLKAKTQKLDEELLICKTELDCLRRELAEKSNELTSERTKSEGYIRGEQV